MMTRIFVSIVACLALLGPVHAEDDLTLDAAIGGAVGGAIGGALGAEVGGRDGAIVGAGVGAAAGTAINTQDHAASKPQRHEYDEHEHRSGDQGDHPKSKFCPPGQAKKGRC